MSLMFLNGQILFSNSMVAMDPACCCDVSSCCGGCSWLYDYWFANGQLKITFSGAITGYWILSAVSPSEPGACTQWELSDLSNASDACNLFSNVSGAAIFWCETTDYSLVPMKLSLGVGGASCGVGGTSADGPDSTSCTAPSPTYGTLSVVFTRPLQELLVGGCATCGFPGNITATVSLYP